MSPFTPVTASNNPAPSRLTIGGFFAELLGIQSVQPVKTKSHGAVSDSIIMHNGMFVLPQMLAGGG
jgi:hypothetical protein